MLADINLDIPILELNTPLVPDAIRLFGLPPDPVTVDLGLASLFFDAEVPSLPSLKRWELYLNLNPGAFPLATSPNGPPAGPATTNIAELTFDMPDLGTSGSLSGGTIVATEKFQDVLDLNFDIDWLPGLEQLNSAHRLRGEPRRCDLAPDISGCRRGSHGRPRAGVRAHSARPQVEARLRSSRLARQWDDRRVVDGQSPGLAADHPARRYRGDRCSHVLCRCRPRELDQSGCPPGNSRATSWPVECRFMGSIHPSVLWKGSRRPKSLGTVALFEDTFDLGGFDSFQTPSFTLRAVPEPTPRAAPEPGERALDLGRSECDCKPTPKEVTTGTRSAGRSVAVVRLRVLRDARGKPGLARGRNFKRAPISLENASRLPVVAFPVDVVERGNGDAS